MKTYKFFRRYCRRLTAVIVSSLIGGTIIARSPSHAITNTTSSLLITQVSDSESALNERLTKLFGDYTRYRDFFFQLQDFVQNDQRSDLAQLIEYPLNVNTNSGSQLSIENETQFLQNYDAIITPGVKSEIINQTYESLSARDQGVMIGSGAVWFSGVCDNSPCPVKVVTINPVAVAVTQDSSNGGTIQSLADGNYRYANGSFSNSIVTDAELSTGILFRFRKQNNRITGDFFYLSTNEAICIQGQVNGNTITGIAVESGDIPFDPVSNISPNNTFALFGPANFLKVRRGRFVDRQVVRYDSAILDLGGWSRINAGTIAPPSRCQ